MPKSWGLPVWLLITLVSIVIIAGCGTHAGHDQASTNTSNVTPLPPTDPSGISYSPTLLDMPPLNMAIDGVGLFILRKPGTVECVYTKLGNFSVDSQGDLVNPQNGYVLQGWKIDENLNNQGTIQDIHMQRLDTSTDLYEILVPYSVTSGGIIYGQAHDGNIYPACRIAVSRFVAPFWLYEESDFMYSPTPQSGPPITSSPGYDGMSSIVPNTIAADLTLTDDLFPLLSIDGQGYFVVRHASAPEEYMYTQSGVLQFSVDRYLVTPAGYIAQGWALDTHTGQHVGALQDIHEEEFTIIKTTTEIQQALALNGNIPNEFVEDTLFDNWNGTNAANPIPIAPLDANKYEYSSTITIIDLLGGSHDITVFFDRTSHDHEWEFLVACQPDEDFRTGYNYLNNKGAGALMYGVVLFDNAGNMSGLACWNVPPDGNPASDWDGNRIARIGAETYYRFTCDFTQSPESIEFIFTPQEAQSFSVTHISQDGYVAGDLNSESVDAEGIITLNYSNGISLQKWQLALAGFSNPSGLTLYEGDIFRQTPDSGPPFIGPPDTLGLGKINSSR